MDKTLLHNLEEEISDVNEVNNCEEYKIATTLIQQAMIKNRETNLIMYFFSYFGFEYKKYYG